MKKTLFKIVAIAAVAVMTTQMATAQTITGTDTFVGANEANTDSQEGGAFTSPFNGGGLWFDQSGLTLNVAGSAGAEANPTDDDIVTTLTGLADGLYEIGIVYGTTVNSNFGFSAGLGADDLSQQELATNPADELGDSFAYGAGFGFVDPFHTILGQVEVTNGSDIEVFINTNADGGFVRNTYNGVTFELVPAAVPEPSSVALLGLGGLAVLARRRR